jgi:hypothetical protein
MRNEGKKHHNFEEMLHNIENKLAEKNSVENKIGVLKNLIEMISIWKGHGHEIEVLCNWIEMMKLVDNLLH